MLICHSSYRGVVGLFRDLFDLPISIGTIHNRLQATAEQATEINQQQDLSGIEVGLHDEIFPDYTIADGGSGLRAGQKAVLPETPCHGDVFHI